MSEEQPRDDWYAEADTYERRLTLAHRIVVMVVVTALAIPVARALDNGRSGEDVATGPEVTTAAQPQPTAGSGEPVPTTIPGGVVTIAPITTGPAADGAAPGAPAAAGNGVDVNGLPEITAAPQATGSSQRRSGDISVDELPEITARPEAAAASAPNQTSAPPSPAPGAASSSGGSDSDGSDAAGSDSAGSDDDEPATTTATTGAPATTTTEDDEPATTTTAAKPTPPSYSADQVKQFIRDAWPDGADEEMALTVAQRESGYRPDAVSPTGCCLGIFQIHYEANQQFINSLGFDRDDLFDASKNVTIAFVMWQRSGWGPWSQTAD